MIKERPKCIIQNCKLLEKNTGENLHDVRMGNDFLDMTPNVQTTNIQTNETVSNLKTSTQKRKQSTK